MKNTFIQYAIIEHEQYAGEGTSYIIGILNLPEQSLTSKEELNKMLQDAFERWYRYTFGEWPYPTNLKWWTFETAIVHVSTEKEDIINHFK